MRKKLGDHNDKKRHEALPSRRMALKNLSLLGLGSVGVLSALANGSDKNAGSQNPYPTETGKPYGRGNAAPGEVGLLTLDADIFCKYCRAVL